MENITLTIPAELKAELKKHKEVNWSAIIRKAMIEHLRKVAIVEAIAQKSKLTKKDVEEIGKKVKEGIARNHGLI